MKESFASRIYRWQFCFFPCYAGSGARVTFIAGDFKEARVRLPLTWRTRNYVGTLFGGSIYSAIDPIYMLMLMKVLGGDYIVWDKSATIHFRKPGRCTLEARFFLDDLEIETIRELLKTEKSVDRVYTVELKDAEGTVYATIEKTIYLKKKS